MEYIEVKWIHIHPDEPVFLYSEIDADGWEVRKLEVFADGRVGFADLTEATASTNTKLSHEPLPSLTEIASDPQFQPTTITPEEFDRLWARRRSAAASQTPLGAF